MPKVSVIIPVYNVEQYLRECLDSVINQTLKDIEIICVNDGSTDSSLEILEEYAQKDSRIKIINKQNTGYGASMNKGIDAATGEYIGIVEPDDYVALDMYETLYNKAIELDLDLIKADFHRFIGEGENIKLFYRKLDRSNSYYNKIINLQEDITPYKFIMNTWSGIYKREFIEKYHIRHNPSPGASFQDNGFWFQTFAWAKRAYFLNQPFYMNRRDNINSSVKSKGKVYAMKYEYDFIMEFLNNNPDIKTRLLPIYWVKKYNNYMFTFDRIDISFKKEFLKVFSKEFKLAEKRKELDWDIFTLNKQRKLKLIIKNPMKFYRYSLVKQIFSIKNKDWHKVITLMGLKLKLKNIKEFLRRGTD